MKTKKKEIISKTAEDLNMHPQDVEAIINDFYGYVRERMSKLEDTKILIPYLGTMHVMKSVVQERKELSERLLNETQNTENMMFFKSKMRYIEDIEMYNNILDKIQKERCNEK